MDEIRELKPDELYRQTDPDLFSFETTAELDDLDQVLGQPRAIEAMEFGLGIEARGYNIFALGPAGTGKRTVVRQYFERRAGEKPVPPDWCYVNNFDETHKPKAIRLPPGMAVGLRQDMNRLIESLSTALSAAFESEEYQARRQSIAGEFQEKQSEAFQELQEEAKSRGVALLRTPSGLAFAPMRDGEVLPSEEIQELSQEEREKLEAEVEELQEDLQKIVRQVPGWQRQVQEKLRDLNREMAEFAVGGLIDELREKYNDHAEVVAHLDAVQKDIVENAQKLTSPSEEEGGLAAMLTGAAG
ncbi:MAG: ATP-binding protein, partial [Anaerolineae bacterium]